VAAIKIRGLTKSYGDKAVLAGLDLTVEAGEVYALLGPNGAGKTTAVEILEGFRPRDGGSVSVLGVDPARADHRWRGRIAVVFQDQAVEPYLTVGETLDFFSLLYPRPRPAGELIELVGLTAEHDKRVQHLSGGQRRRLDLAIALVGDPELVFLDEPTTGFDPAARVHAWEVVRQMGALGKTVVLTTHYLDEAQHLADRVGIVLGGRIAVEGPPDTLGQIGGLDTQATIRFRLPPGLTPGELPLPAAVDHGMVSIHSATPTAALAELAPWAEARHLELPELTVTRPSLEDVYLELTQP
jgi:ABC-2 type transport system ATP-binding protein